MDAIRRRLSLFSQRFDRIAFVAYFLGAVVPLAALAVTIRRLDLEPSESVAWTAALVGVAVLSLGAFLALRRTTRLTLRRLDGENRRLTALLDVSEALANAEDLTMAAATASRHAVAMVGARAAFVARADTDGRPEVVDCAGLRADAAGLVLESLPSAVFRAGAELGVQAARIPGQDGPAGALVASLSGEDGLVGWLVVLRDDATEPDPEERDGLAALAGLASASLANADLRHAQRNFFAHVVGLLTSALDAHLGYQRGHGDRVACLVNRLGRRMGLSEERLHDLHFAALLHDIGLLRIERERHDDPEAFRAHPRLGFQALAPIRLWEKSAPLVLHHHERFDGGGYPDGLAGSEIPLESRILATCESFDAMTCNTAYQRTKTFEEALEELRAGAGTQFDPEVVEVFLALVEEGVIEPESAPAVPTAV